MSDPLHRKVRNFLDFNHNAFLATSSNKHKGYPFGSITPYDSGGDGRPVIFISFLAEHYKNLVKDQKGCLTIPDWYGHRDPQNFARLSVIGEWSKVEPKEVEDSYWARFPEAVERQLAHNFCFYKLEPFKFRWIGGFGEIYWFEPEEILNLEREDICYTSLPAVRHMNEDHLDAIRDYLALADVKQEDRPKEWELEMTYLDKAGFIIRSSKGKSWEIKFPKPIAKPEHLRADIIKLLKSARA